MSSCSASPVSTSSKTVKGATLPLMRSAEPKEAKASGHDSSGSVSRGDVLLETVSTVALTFAKPDFAVSSVGSALLFRGRKLRDEGATGGRPFDDLLRTDGVDLGQTGGNE